MPNNATHPPRPRTFTLFDMLMSIESGKFSLLMYKLGQAKIALEKGGDAENVGSIQALLSFVRDSVHSLPVSNMIKEQAKRLDARISKATLRVDLPDGVPLTVEGGGSGESPC